MNAANEKKLCKLWGKLVGKFRHKISKVFMEEIEKNTPDIEEIIFLEKEIKDINVKLSQLIRKSKSLKEKNPFARAMLIIRGGKFKYYDIIKAMEELFQWNGKKRDEFCLILADIAGNYLQDYGKISAEEDNTRKYSDYPDYNGLNTIPLCQNADKIVKIIAQIKGYDEKKAEIYKKLDWDEAYNKRRFPKKV